MLKISVIMLDSVTVYCNVRGQCYIVTDHASVTVYSKVCMIVFIVVAMSQ